MFFKRRAMILLCPKPQECPDSCQNTNTNVDLKVSPLIHSRPVTGILVAQYFNYLPLSLSVPCLLPCNLDLTYKLKEGTSPGV